LTTLAKPIELGRTYDVEFSPDGLHLVNVSRQVTVWNIATGNKVFSARPLSDPSCAVFHPSGSYIAVKNTSGRIALLETASGNLLGRLKRPHDEEGSNLVFSPCGEFLVHASWGGRLMVVQPSTGDLVVSKEFPATLIRQVARHPLDETWIIVHSPMATSRTERPPPDYLTLWSRPLVEPRARVSLSVHDINEFAVSPDGRWIATLDVKELTLHR
jgi:WD40 repeat protein